MCFAPRRSAGDGACSNLKMFNILIIQLLSKGGEMHTEREREGGREETCSDPGQIIRDYTQSVTPLHSQCITHFKLNLHPAACINHSAVSSQMRRLHWKDNSLETSDTLVVIYMCVCVQVPSQQ